MIVSCLICLLYFEVQQFTVVATESTVSAPHSNYFVNHVQPVFRQLAALVLLTYYHLWVFVLSSFFI